MLQCCNEAWQATLLFAMVSRAWQPGDRVGSRVANSPHVLSWCNRCNRVTVNPNLRVDKGLSI
jgi:hypothetical protein